MQEEGARWKKKKALPREHEEEHPRILHRLFRAPGRERGVPHKRKKTTWLFDGRERERDERGERGEGREEAGVM